MNTSKAKVNKINQDNSYSEVISKLSNRELLELMEDRERIMYLCTDAFYMEKEIPDCKVVADPEALQMAFIRYQELVDELKSRIN